MPASVFEKAYVQTLTIIQPVDALEEGGFDMCDGCPDMTVYKGKMYWSCRLEEVKRFGCFVNAVPRPNSRLAMRAPRPASQLSLIVSCLTPHETTDTDARFVQPV
jgi:hypothetical protein